MKIIGISNFDLDYIDDILIAENVKEYYGKKIVNLLIEDMQEDDKYFYKLVDNNYKLYKNDLP